MGHCLASLAAVGIEVCLAARTAASPVAQDVSPGLDGRIRRGRQAGGDDEEATRPLDDGGQTTLVQLPAVHYGGFSAGLSLKAAVLVSSPWCTSLPTFVVRVMVIDPQPAPPLSS